MDALIKRPRQRKDIQMFRFILVVITLFLYLNDSVTNNVVITIINTTVTGITIVNNIPFE